MLHLSLICLKPYKRYGTIVTSDINTVSFQVDQDQLNTIITDIINPLNVLLPD